MTLRRGIAPGEYYHIVTRGAQRQPIFKDKCDWQRFLFGILYLQSPHTFNHVSKTARSYSDEGFLVDLATVSEVLNERFVELTAFCLMPNHFHLLVKEVEESGMSRYMQRVLNGYTKYFNAKYSATGHVFQDRYREVHVTSGRQLLYLSAYIHRNPREMKVWKGKEDAYPWSSLQDYVSGNRWGGMLMTDIIASQFGATKNSNYADFVKTSTAKILEDELAQILV